MGLLELLGGFWSCWGFLELLGVVVIVVVEGRFAGRPGGLLEGLQTGVRRGLRRGLQ